MGWNGEGVTDIKCPKCGARMNLESGSWSEQPPDAFRLSCPKCDYFEDMDYDEGYDLMMKMVEEFYREAKRRVMLSLEKKSKCTMKKVKKVSFRVRRIYYDQYVNGTKREELRALKPYWVKILRPSIPVRLINHPLIETAFRHLRPDEITCEAQPKIAVISCPSQPTLRFKITGIWVDIPERILGRELSEQGRKDIPTELCIVTKMGERIV